MFALARLIKVSSIGLIVGSLAAGCVGSGHGKTRAYTVNGVVAGTAVAGMLISSQVMKADDSGLDMGPTLAYVWGGLALATVAGLSLITAQMPDTEDSLGEEVVGTRLELIPTPRSIHVD